MTMWVFCLLHLWKQGRFFSCSCILYKCNLMCFLLYEDFFRLLRTIVSLEATKSSKKVVDLTYTRVREGSRVNRGQFGWKSIKKTLNTNQKLTNSLGDVLWVKKESCYIHLKTGLNAVFLFFSMGVFRRLLCYIYCL